MRESDILVSMVASELVITVENNVSILFAVITSLLFTKPRVVTTFWMKVIVSCITNVLGVLTGGIVVETFICVIRICSDVGALVIESFRKLIMVDTRLLTVVAFKRVIGFSELDFSVLIFDVSVF